LKSLQALSVKLNQVCGRNLGKALFGFFFMAILETIAMMVIVLPSLSLLSSENEDSPFFLAGACILGFCALEVWLLFQYGFASMLLRMVRGQFVTMGFIFMGFKTLRKSLKPTLFFSIIFALIFALIQLVLYLLSDEVTSFIDSWGMNAFVALLAGVLVLLFLFVILQGAFLFQISFEEDISFFSQLKKNHHLLKGKRFTLIRLIFIAGGRHLLIAATAFVFTQILSTLGENTSRLLALIGLILSFIYFVNAYTALIRMYFAVPVLYDNLTHVDVVVEDKWDVNTLILEETAALLAEKAAKSAPAEDPAAEADKTSPAEAPATETDSSSPAEDPSSSKGN